MNGKFGKSREKLAESLSAMMDDEASEFEFRRVLKESAADTEVKYKWERYHMLSAVLRGDLDRHSVKPENRKHSDLLSRIHEQLADEGVAGFSASSRAEGVKTRSAEGAMEVFMKRLGQGAIAASVAAAVLIGANSINSTVDVATQLELAAQEEPNNLPLFNDNYSPTQFSRVPRVDSELVGVADSDAAARDRLIQAVYQEFVGEPQESIELPVNFSITREAIPAREQQQ